MAAFMQTIFCRLYKPQLTKHFPLIHRYYSSNIYDDNGNGQSKDRKDYDFPDLTSVPGRSKQDLSKMTNIPSGTEEDNEQRLNWKAYDEFSDLTSVPDRSKEDLSEMTSVAHGREEASSSNACDKDIEELFTHYQVQHILKILTHLDLEKVFSFRKAAIRKPRYHVMSETQLQKVLEMARVKAKQKIQMPPIVKSWTNTPTVYSEDPEIDGLETARYVFVDINPDISDRKRLIVVREPNGTLQKPTWEDHYRYCQMYFPRPGRNHIIPKMFIKQNLEAVLESGKYEFTLDRACVQFEPDDPEYKRVCAQVYNHIDRQCKFDVLRSTRHFGGMVFYFLLHKRLDNILVDMIRRAFLEDAVLLIQAYHIIHPSCASASLTISPDDQMKLIQAFAELECKHHHKIVMALHIYEEQNPKEQAMTA